MKLPKLTSVTVTITPRRVLIVLALVGLVGLSTYQLFELRGLRARVHTLESSGYSSWAYENAYIEANGDNEVQYDEVSRTTETLRVIKDYAVYTEDEVEYEEKELLVFQVEITNNMDWVYDYSDYNVRGKTAEGQLISGIGQYNIHEEDRKGLDSFSLSPGGKATVYIYFETDQGIEELYFDGYYDV